MNPIERVIINITSAFGIDLLRRENNPDTCKDTFNRENAKLKGENEENGYPAQGYDRYLTGR